MIKPVAITVDSPCDLPEALIARHHLYITPLTITLGDDSYLDGVDITPDDIFAYHARTGETSKTAAVPPQRYIDLFEKLLGEGYEIVHISLSSKISSSCQNALIAAGGMGGVHVVDSLALHTGMAHLALDACDLREAGLSAAEIAQRLRVMAPKIKTSFIVNTLDYLKAGGRCSALTAFGANLLSIKPCIEMKDGALGVGKKYRGKMEAAYAQYLEEKLAEPSRIDTRRLFLSHSGLSDAFMQQMQELAQRKGIFEEVILSVAGCTISTHSGPDAFAVIYQEK